VSRYIVTEIEGYGVRAAGAARRGLSVHVLDTLVCHRIVRTWRTEDYGSTAFKGRAAKDRWIRNAAAVFAARLNAEHDAALR